MTVGRLNQPLGALNADFPFRELNRMDGGTNGVSILFFTNSPRFLRRHSRALVRRL